MEIRACELLCQLNSKGEDISTMVFSSDLYVQAGFLMGKGWIAEGSLCHEADERNHSGHLRKRL